MKKLIIPLIVLLVCLVGVNALVTTEEFLGQNQPLNPNRNNQEGVVFNMSSPNCELTNVGVHPSTTATRVLLYQIDVRGDVGGSLINTSIDVTNNVYTFPSKPLNNTINGSNFEYALVCDNSGVAYNLRGRDGLVFPFKNNNSVFHGGIRIAGTRWSNQAMCITNVTFNCGEASPPVNVNITAPFNDTHFGINEIETRNNKIEINATHDTSGSTCLINDTEYVYVSNSSNEWTFKNNSVVTAGERHIKITCNSTPSNQGEDSILFFVDLVKPMITLDNPSGNNSNIGTGDLLNITCNDDNLESFTGEVFFKDTMTEVLNWTFTGITGTSQNYTQPFGSGLSSGEYLGIYQCNDSHTFNNIDELVYTNDGIGSTYQYKGSLLRETNVNGVESQRLIKQGDRIITEYTKTNPVVWVEKLLYCNTGFIKPAKNNFKGHLLCGSMWVDQVTNYDDEIELNKIDNNYYSVMIRSNERIFRTESVGIINTETIHHQFYLDVNSNIDILISNVTRIYKTLVSEQEDFKIYVNWTNSTGQPITNDTGNCNITSFNISREQKADNLNFTLCGVGGCDFQTFTNEFNFIDTINTQKDFVHFDKLCHEIIAQDNINVTFQCGASSESLTVLAVNMPLCSSTNGETFVNSTVCISSQKLNVSVEYTGSFGRRKRVEGFSLHREYSKHLMPYNENNTIYNSSIGLWHVNYFTEWFAHGNKFIEANCSDGGLSNNTRESFTVVNIPPSIEYAQVINNENVTNLVNGVGVEYSQGVYTWVIDINDDDLLNFSVRFYNSSGDSIINLSSLPLTTPDQLFLSKANPYTIQTTAFDVLGLKSESNLTFNSVGDVTQPSIILLNNGSSFTANQSFNIRYRPDDDGLIDNCSIYVNWNGTVHLNQTDTSITTNSVNEFGLSWHTRNNYSYFINCTDSKGFLNVSGTGVFTIINQTVSVVSMYNSNFLFDMGWFSNDFTPTTTAGVMLYFFLLFVTIALIVLGEFTRIPIISVFAGLVGMLYGWLLASSLSSLIGVMFMITALFYVIFSVVRD